jgi:hypothetical protein
MSTETATAKGKVIIALPATVIIALPATFIIALPATVIIALLATFIVALPARVRSFSRLAATVHYFAMRPGDKENLRAAAMFLFISCQIVTLKAAHFSIFIP